MSSRFLSYGSNICKSAVRHSSNFDRTVLEKFLFRIAKKWVAGYSSAEALARATDSYHNGMLPIVNFLGEHSNSEDIAYAATNQYCELLDLINDRKIKGEISVKPTQLGLSIGYDVCLNNLRRLAKKAESAKGFVWVDMESFEFVERTISLYLDVLKSYNSFGIALQAYLKRSSSDLIHLLENGAKVRLVKGAYNENQIVAYKSGAAINKNYEKMMTMLFNDPLCTRFAIATHDSRLIDAAVKLSRQLENRNNFEFQFLMGIRDDLKRSLVREGFCVSEYIPYGDNWLPYSIRRLRERKRNLLLLMRSLI